MTKWPHQIDIHSYYEISQAVADESWQLFRLSLKGLTTISKLDKLEAYLGSIRDPSNPIKVRVDNYINALKRGGQLSTEGVVRR